MKSQFAAVFKTKSRDEWIKIFKGKDACVAPVLELNEVDRHSHNLKRGLLISVDGLSQPAPAPRLSRTPGIVKKMADPRGSHTREILKEFGYSEEQVIRLIKEGVIE